MFPACCEANSINEFRARDCLQDSLVVPAHSAVTPAMIRAGLTEMVTWRQGDDTVEMSDEVVKTTYLAMEAVRIQSYMESK